MKKKKKVEYLNRIQIELFTVQEEKLKERFFRMVKTQGLSAKYVILELMQEYCRKK